MIQIVSRGSYSLVDDGVQKFVLCDDEDSLCYSVHYHGQKLCVYPVSRPDEAVKHIRGRYRVYHVLDERSFTDGYHLELQHNCQAWQAYHTPQLPNGANEHASLTPTIEQVTKTTSCCCKSLDIS